MTDHAAYFYLEIRLTIVAGECGIFPEPELILWLRAVSSGSGKILVVQPIEPIAAEREVAPRNYRAKEHIVTSDRVSALVSKLNALGFPGRTPEIENTGDPETVWWLSPALKVTLDDESARFQFTVGPDGVRGRDADTMKTIFQALLECAAVQFPRSDLLVGSTNGPC